MPQARFPVSDGRMESQELTADGGIRVEIIGAPAWVEEAWRKQSCAIASSASSPHDARSASSPPSARRCMFPSAASPWRRPHGAASTSRPHGGVLALRPAKTPQNLLIRL